jgi:hypothetical protein
MVTENVVITFRLEHGIINIIIVIVSIATLIILTIINISTFIILFCMLANTTIITTMSINIIIAIPSSPP